MMPESIGESERAGAGRAGSRLWPRVVSWRAAVFVVVGLCVARAVFNATINPWHLFGDEAYYWMQAKHLDWCYDEKGPLLAWIIAASVRVLGDSAWAVRLPMVLSWGLAALGVGWLARATSAAKGPAGAGAMLLFVLLPGFQVNAQFCTQDGPMVTLWVAMTMLCLVLFRRWANGVSTWGPWMLFYVLLGLGVLLKQSVFTFMPGMALFWWFERRRLPLRGVFFAQQAVGVLVLAAMCAPMLLWNASHGWPLINHTLGHLGAGGDQAGRVNPGNPLLWEGAIVGALAGFFGPCLILMAWAGVRGWRDEPGSDRAFDRRWLVCSAWPATLFYMALALTKPVIATWPIPNMAPLCALAAAWVVDGAWRGAPGKARRFLWSATFIYGTLSMLVLAYPNPLFALRPEAIRPLEKKMLGGFGGSDEYARRLQRVIEEESRPGQPPPLVVGPTYSLASAMTFYLPGHPGVGARDSVVTHRRSNLQNWPETDLEDPSQIGRTLILVLGHRDDPVWGDWFITDPVVPSSDRDFVIGRNFKGIRANGGEVKSDGGPEGKR